MRVLGIDPTATGSGAAAILDGDDLVTWYVWTRVRAGWRVRYGGADITTGTLHGVGCHIGSGLPVDRLVVEGLYSPARWQRRASGADVIALAEALGETLGPIRQRCATPPLRPTAREWRAHIGAARLAAGAAEDVAIRWATAREYVPMGLTVAEQGALAEACVMAAWGGGR